MNLNHCKMHFLKWMYYRYIQISLIKSLLINLKLTNKLIVNHKIYPGVKLYISKYSKLECAIKSQLIFGNKWEHTAYLPSCFKLEDNAVFYIRGSFRFFTGCHVYINNNARLEIGSGYCNSNAEINCFKSITIGNNVVISKYVIIRDSDNHYIVGSEKEVSKPIVIEDDVWIGLRATILKGVTIGKGSVIAAGAVVTRDVPQYSLVAGVPARVIKKDVQWKH